MPGRIVFQKDPASFVHAARTPIGTTGANFYATSFAGIAVGVWVFGKLLSIIVLIWGLFRFGESLARTSEFTRDRDLGTTFQQPWGQPWF